MSPIKYLRICSDLHLEFHRSRPLENNLLDLLPRDDRDKESVLVLAGDIHVNYLSLLQALGFLKARFAEVFYIPGNHEYYRHDMENWWEVEDESPTPFIGNQEYPIYYQLTPLIQLVGITLWGDGGGDDPLKNLAVASMNDFALIKVKGNPFTLTQMQALNKLHSHRLEQAIKGKKSTIVVTHHLPSYSLCDPKYSPSNYDGLFASNQEHLMSGPSAPVLWICGHTHYNIDRKLGDTRVISNPAGYPGEHAVDYNPRCFIDLEDLNVT